MPVNNLIINFHGFLVACWPNISKVLEQLDWDESPYFLDNWMQANWELIVEEQALESGRLLVPYGYNSSPRCRYTCKDGKLTHRVICRKKGQLESRYNFLCFVSKENGVFKVEPPFDFISVEDVENGERLRLAFDEVHFSIEKMR